MTHPILTQGMLRGSAAAAALLLATALPSVHAEVAPLDDTTLADFEFTGTGAAQVQAMREAGLLEIAPVLRGPAVVDGVEYKHMGWPVVARFPWPVAENPANERSVVLVRNLYNHSPGDYKARPNNSRRVVYADGGMSTWLPENVRTALPVLGINPEVDHDNNATTPTIRFPGNYDYLGMHAMNWIYPNGDSSKPPRLVVVTAKYDIADAADATAVLPVSTQVRFNFRVYTSDDGGVRWTEQDQALSKIQVENPTANSRLAHIGPNLVRHPEFGLVVPFGKYDAGVNTNNAIIRTADGVTWERIIWKNDFTVENRSIEPSLVTWGAGHMLIIGRERTDGLGYDEATGFYTYTQHLYKHETGKPFSQVKFVGKKTNIVGNGYDPKALKGSAYEAHDTPEVIYNPVTGRLEVIQGHRWGGGAGKTRPMVDGQPVPLAEHPELAVNSLNIWSIDPIDLLKGEATWRFDGTIIEREGVILGGAQVAAAGVAKAYQDGYHPGGSVVDEKTGMHHLFIYVGKYTSYANAYRVSRTLDTYAFRAAAGLSNDPAPAIASVAYADKENGAGVNPGDTITINGSNLSTCKEVLIGGASATIDTLASTVGKIVVTAPAGAVGGDVEVRTEWGRTVSAGQVVFNTAPVFSAAVARQTAVAGKPVNISANVTALPSAVCQWQARPAVGGAWQDLQDGSDCANTQSAVLTILTPAAFAGWQFRCVAVNALGAGAGEAVTLAVIPDYLAAPSGMAVSSGSDGRSIYVADSARHTIHAVSPANTLSLLAGRNGEPGSADGAGADARFNQPRGLAISNAGILMVADAGNHKIRSVTASGSVATVGAGPDAVFASPSGLAARDAAPGETYVADTENHLVKKISAVGAVSIVAGSGTAGFGDGPALAASFNAPRGVAVDVAGNLYVADTGNHAVRFIDMAAGGSVATLAGQPGMPGDADGDALGAAAFRSPAHVLIDGEGDVYVADTGNHRVRVIISDTTQPSGLLVETLAGGGTSGFADGAGTNALFSDPSAISLSAEGDIYVADTGNGAIRRIANDDAATVSTIMLNGPLNPLPASAPRPSEEAGGGGGAPAPWLLAALAVLCALRARRRA